MRVDTHWPLALGLILIAGFGTWVFIHSNRSYLLRWVLIPVSLVVAVLSARIYDAGLGYAVAAELPHKFLYLGHQVVVEKKRKAGIDVWAQTGSTRLYRIPYSKPAEQAMDQAREQAKSGQPVVMQKRPAEASSTGEGPMMEAESEQPYESNVVLPSDLDPKRVARNSISER
jgi:hypothetical protein